MSHILILQIIDSSVILLIYRLLELTDVVLLHLEVAKAIFLSGLHEESMSQSFLWSYPITWVLDKHPEDNVFNLFRILPESPVVHVRVLVFNESECSFSILALKWKLTANKCVEDDPC